VALDGRAKSGSTTAKSAAAAVYTTDADGRITFFNETAAVCGPSPNAERRQVVRFMRMWWLDGTPLPHDQCRCRRVEGRTSHRRQEAVVERPTAHACRSWRSIALRDATGQVVGAVNMFVDITERKRNEEMAHGLPPSSSPATMRSSAKARWHGHKLEQWRGALFGYAADEIIASPSGL